MVIVMKEPYTSHFIHVTVFFMRYICPQLEFPQAEEAEGLSFSLPRY